MTQSENQQKLAFVAGKEKAHSKQTISSYVSKKLCPLLSDSFAITLIDEEKTLDTVECSAFKTCFVNIEHHVDALFSCRALSTLSAKGFRGKSVAYVHDLHVVDTDFLKEYDYVFSSSPLTLRQLTEKNIKATYLPYPVAIEKKSNSNSKMFNKLAYAGGFGIEFRADKIIQALSELEQEVEFNWMLPVEEQGRALALCKKYSFSNIKFESCYTFDTWKRMCETANAIALPNVSAVIGLGPLLPIALNSGKNVLVSDFADAGDLPNEIVSKVEIGYCEVKNWMTAFLKLDLSDEIKLASNKSLDYIKEVHDKKVIAHLLKQKCLM